MSKTNLNYDADRDLYSGLIRLHVLHHAVEGPIFGLGMAEELARHGYRISPGTLRKPGAILRKCAAQAWRSIDGGRRYCTIAVINNFTPSDFTMRQ